MPKLGIFWVHDGQILGRARPLDEGCERWPGLLDSPDEHYRLWEERGFRRAHPELALLDYTEVPRGRVIYSTKEGQATIYLDEVLSGGAVRRRIRAFFDLAATPVRWAGDPHYTTDSEKIEALFRPGSS